MRSLSKVIILFAAVTALGGCTNIQPLTMLTKQQAINQVPTPFSQGSIALIIRANPDLNSWNEIANSCTVLVIQAHKAISLNKVLSDPAQLKSLFHGAGAEDDILKVDRYAVMPGQVTTLHIDRSENALQVAIVAGYYPFPQKQHMAIVNIPIILTSNGWWTKRWSAKLSPLTIDVTLGAQGIIQLNKI